MKKITWILVGVGIFGGVRLAQKIDHAEMSAGVEKEDARTTGSLPSAPTSQDLKTTVVANACNQLDSMFGQGRYEILSSDLTSVDQEMTNVNYSMELIMLIRFQDPYGYLKRYVRFAAFNNGSVMMLTDPSELYRG